MLAASSQGVRLARLFGAALAAVMVLALLAAALPRLSGTASAATTVVRDVKITIRCSLTRGEPVSRCRGTWRMTGQMRDSGRLFSSQSDDRGGTGAVLKTVLKGRNGEITASDSGLRVAHRRRDCLYVTSFSLRGDKGRYEGFRGDTVRPVCTQLKISSGRIARSSEFTVQLTKRV